MEKNFWNGKKVLVTGGAGFIGSFVTEELVSRGAFVRIPTRNDSELKNINHLGGKFEVMKGDLLDPHFAEKAAEGQDAIFHIASYKRNIEFHQRYPADILRINSLITLNVFEAAKRASVGRVLLMSSGIVYGKESATPNKEEEGFLGEVEGAHFGYAWSKRFSEVVAKGYAMQSGMKVAIARPYNIFGPRDNFDKETAQVVPAFIRRVVEGEDPFVMWGDGTQERSFLYVEDLARGVVDLLEKYPECDPVNFGTDETVKLRDLARIIMDIEGVNPKVEFDLTKPGGFSKRNCDNRKSFEKIGFMPKYSLRGGLEKTLVWYKESRKNLI